MISRLFTGYSYPKDLPRPLKLTRLATKIVAVLALMVFVSLLIIQFTTGKATSLAGLAIDSHDNLYVPDGGNQVVKKFDSQGNLLLSWGSAGNGDGQFGTPLSPNKLAVGSDDEIYVVDANNQRVQKFDSSGKFLTKWGSQEQFFYSTSIVVNKQGQVNLALKGIQKFDVNGNYLGSALDESASSLQLNTFSGLAVDDAGTLFVMDSGRNSIYAFSADGKLDRTIPLVGDFTQVFNFQNLVVDHQGNFYVSDQIFNKILKFDRDGKFLITWKVNPNDSLNTYSGMVVDSRNNIYILNQENEQITVFDSNGQNLRQISIGWRWLTKNSFFVYLPFFFINLVLALLSQYFLKKYNIKKVEIDLKATTKAGRASQYIGLPASAFGLLVGMPVVAVFSVINPGSSFLPSDLTIFGSNYYQTILAILLMTGLNSLVLNMVFLVKKRPTLVGILEIISGVILFFVIPTTVLKLLPVAIIVAGVLALFEANEKKLIAEKA